MLPIGVVKAQSSLPADKHATKETINLYRNLKKSLQKGIMFGHQDRYAYGVGCKYEPGKSDIKAVTGDYPAVVGCEIGRMELDWEKDLDGLTFSSSIHFSEQA